jgi:histidyl-tRNA synthetase
MLQRIRGTQDVLDLRPYNRLLELMRQHLATYNFDEIITPIIEPTELFKRSLGLHTDVVSKEMYLVTTTHDSEESICLRPEMTASTMRAFFNASVDQRPWRVFSCGPVFRHERPQKGRFRQFSQVNIELIGAESVAFDAEFIAMVDDFFGTVLRMQNYVLALNFLGSPADRENYKTVLNSFLDAQPNLPEKIRERQKTNILRIFDLKDEECQKALENAPVMTDYLCPESQAEWVHLRQLLDQLSVTHIHNPRLVRGLDYYNKTVFEFVGGNLGAQNALCGGGRYDFLSQTLGERDAVPAIGVGIGIERLLLSLEGHVQFVIPPRPALTVVIPFSPAQVPLALLCASEIRAVGLCCEAFLDGGSIKNMLRKANKAGAQQVVLIGEDEQANNYVTLKHMVAGTEEKVGQAELVARIKRQG